MVIVAQAVLLAHIISASAVGHEPLSALRGSLIALIAVIALRALLAGSFELSGRIGAVRVMSELRLRLTRRLLIDRPGRSPRERTGELAAASVQGIDSLENYFAGYLPSLVLAAAVPLAVLVYLAGVDLVAAVILAITIPVLVIFMILIGMGAQSRTRSRWQALTLLSSHFLDVVQGLETLRAHRREEAQAEILEDVGERYRRETMGTLRLAFMSALVLELCAMLGTALVAATIGVQLIGGNLTLDAGLVVLLLAPELYNPLRAVGQQFHASADGLAAAGRVLAVLDEREPLPLAEHPRPAGDPRTQPLRFECVTFSYPSRPGAVLEDLSPRDRRERVRRARRTERHRQEHGRGARAAPRRPDRRPCRVRDGRSEGDQHRGVAAADRVGASARQAVRRDDRGQHRAVGPRQRARRDRVRRPRRRARRAAVGASGWS